LPPEAPQKLSAARATVGVSLHWDEPHDDTGVIDYVITRDSRVVALVTTTSYLDPVAPATSATYAIIARDAATNESAPATAVVAAAPGP